MEGAVGEKGKLGGENFIGKLFSELYFFHKTIYLKHGASIFGFLLFIYYI